MIKINSITHADFEPPCGFLNWSRQHNHTHHIFKSHRDEKLPHAKDSDILLVMGGPQSPNEEDKYPYLKNEIKLIEATLTANKTVIGVCLGAQLLARALGSTVSRSPHKEVGFYPITMNETSKQNPLFGDWPETFDVMHWHYDMPNLSEDMTHHATSEGCPNQIFSYEDHAFGFQCHLELTQSKTRALINFCPQDLEASEFTQTPEQILQGPFDEMNQYLFSFLDKLTK